MPFPGSPFEDPNIVPFADASGEDWLRNNIPPEWSGAPPSPIDPNEIQMPPVNARPSIGFPHDPGPGVIEAPPTPAPDLAAPVEQAALQPGLGIPTHAVDQALDQFPMPDAISGVGGSAQDLGELAAPGAGDGTVYPEAHGVELTDEQRARQFAASSPEDQARTQFLDQQRRQDEENARRSQVALEDQQRALENHSAMVKAQAAAREATVKLDEDGKRLAETEIDTHVDAGVAGLVAAVVGGLVSSRQGGPNQGLAMIERMVERKIDAQKTKMANQRAELQRRGASIQQLAALDASAFEEAERFRISAYTAAQNQVSSEMVKYDQRGKTVLELGKTYAQIGAARAKALVDFEDKTFKQQMEAYNFKSKAEKDAAELLKTQAETQKLGAETAKIRGAIGGGTGKVDPQDVIHPPEHFAALGLPAPPAAMSFNGYNNLQKTKKAAGEATTGSSSLSKEQLEHGVSDLKTEDGQPFLAQGSPESVSKLRDSVAASRTLVRLMDEALAIRSGWTSDLAKSKEWQQLQANWNNAVGVAGRVLGLGALSDKDFELAASFIGAKDPTALIDPTAGIKKARENIIGMTRDELNAAGANGKAKFDIPFIPPRPPKPTASDQAQKAALSKPNAGDVIDEAKSTDPTLGNILKGKGVVQTRSVADVAGDFEKNARTHVEQLDAVLSSKDTSPEERAKAQALLNELVQSAPPVVADYARSVLARQQLDAGDTGHALHQSGVAYDEVPPRPPLEPNKPKGAKKR